MKYKAFISYSHAIDGELAPALQKALRLLAKPWYQKQVFDIFRDQTNLSTSPHLWGDIETALSESEYFILLASPGASRSEWVQKEVEYWIANRSVDTLIIVLTEGEIVWDNRVKEFDWHRSSAIPPSLKGRYAEIPLWADLLSLRKQEDLSLDNERFMESIKPIAATLHHKTVDELFGDIKRQHRRTLLIRNIVIATLAILLAISALLGKIAQEKTVVAEEQGAFSEARWLGAQSQLSRENGIIGPQTVSLAVSSLKRARTEVGYRALVAAMELTRPVAAVSNHGAPLKALSLSGDERFVAVGGANGSVHILRSSTSKRVFKITLPMAISHTIFSPDDAFILITNETHAQSKSDSLALWESDDLVLRCIESVDGKTVFEKKVPTPARIPIFSHDGKYLAFAGPLTVHVWESATGKAISTLKHEGLILDIAFSPDGKVLAAGVGREQISSETDREYWRWSGQEEALYIWEWKDETLKKKQPTDSSVVNVAFGANGALAARTRHNRIWLLNPNGDESQVLNQGGGAQFLITEAQGLSFSANGRYLAAAVGHSKVSVWETGQNDSRIFTTFDNGRGRLKSLFFTGAGTLIVTGTKRVGRVWTVQGEELTQALHGGSLTAIAYAAKQELLLTAGDAGTLKFHDMKQALNRQDLLPGTFEFDDSFEKQPEPGTLLKIDKLLYRAYRILSQDSYWRQEGKMNPDAVNSLFPGDKELDRLKRRALRKTYNELINDGALAALKEIKSDDPLIRRKGAARLGSTQNSPRVARALAKLLRDDGDIKVRQKAAKSLRSLDRRSSLLDVSDVAIPALTGALASSDDDIVCREAAMMMGSLGDRVQTFKRLRQKKAVLWQPHLERAASTLLMRVNDRSPETRRAVIRALAKIGTRKNETISSLLKILENRKEVARDEALVSLHRISPEPGLHKRLLDIGLYDSNDRVVAAALSIVGRKGLDDAAYLPRLRQLQTAPNKTVSKKSVGAINRVKEAMK